MNIDIKLKTYEQLQQEVITLNTNSYLKNLKIKQLQSNWNSLREWLEDKQNLVCGCGITAEYIYAYEDVLDKMNELEIGDNK